MSFARFKKTHVRAFNAGHPSPSNPKWTALRNRVRVDLNLTNRERAAVECLMNRMESHPMEIPILRLIILPGFGVHPNPVLRGMDEQINDTDGGNE